MADVDDLRGGADAPDDAFQRADEAVFGTKVSGEGDDRHREKGLGNQDQWTAVLAGWRILAMILSSYFIPRPPIIHRASPSDITNMSSIAVFMF